LDKFSSTTNLNFTYYVQRSWILRYFKAI
jgi:hypothetical protein